MMKGGDEKGGEGGEGGLCLLPDKAILRLRQTPRHDATRWGGRGGPCGGPLETYRRINNKSIAMVWDFRAGAN